MATTSVRDIVRANDRGCNAATLEAVRAGLAAAGVTGRTAQDALIVASWLAGQITGSAFEGGRGTTPAVLASLLEFQGEKFGALHVRD
jgi:uncharacterized membrane protein (DUF441 family)